jgi:hypothetical protein
MATGDWRRWALDLGRAYADIAMIARFAPGGAPGDHVAIVMKDGAQTPWFAAGKGLDGVAWSAVPGRDALSRLLADDRLRRPDLHVYVSFCDTRPLLFAYDGGRERIAGEALIDARYRMLYPDGDRPPLEEFYLHWGEPIDAADRAPGRE